MSYLKEVLTNCGVILSTNDEESNVLTQEQSLVIRDIEKYFAKDDKEENIKNFIRDLKRLCGNRNAFRSVLLPTVLKKTVSENESVSVRQESLVRILLNVDDLQSEIIAILLEEMTRCASENNAEDEAFLKHCLNAFRYLPYMKELERVTDRILDILDICTMELQVEILIVLPDIVPDSCCDKAARELCRFLRDSSELTAAIVNCLNCLNLTNETKIEVENSLLQRLSDLDAVKNFAVLYEFLTENCTKLSLNGVLIRCRDALGEVLLSEDAESVSLKTIIIDKISCSISTKNIYEGYVNFLSKTTERKPIDVLLFFILHSAVSNKKQKIEILFKKQVKADLLKLSHLDVFYEKYLNKYILKNYLNSMMEIGSVLLKDNDTIEFSTSMYKLMFENGNVNDMHRQEIMQNLIMLSQFWDTKNISQIFNVLSVLTENKITKRYANKFMLLLYKLDEYLLGDVKKIFDILCTLVCNDTNYSGLKDELHIVVRKQLSMPEIYLKRQGIIGATTIVKHLLMGEEGPSVDFDDDSIASDDFPTNVKESIDLLHMAESTCDKSTELMGLFYDQLANIIANNKLDRIFLKWLYEKITNDFQNKYVVEAIPDPVDNIEFSSEYSLNLIEELDTQIYINIAELTIKKSYASTVYSIEILAPFFRLLRLLHYKEHNGDLSTINALLGSGIILPSIDNFDSYSKEQLRNIADSFYHCANWFREIISAFAAQHMKILRRKVLSRLRHLIDVETTLNKIMLEIPEHILPTSYFYIDDKVDLNPKSMVRKTVKCRKKRKLNESLLLNESGISTSIRNTASKAGSSQKTIPKNELNSKRTQTTSMESKYNFRDLDTDIMVLLKYPLKLDTGDLEQMSQLTQQTTIDVPSFDFLLNDLAKKLETLTKNSHNTKDLPLRSISVVDPKNIITDSIRLLPNVYNKFQVISKRLKTILEEIDYVYDHHNLFTEEANTLKQTFCSVLKCLKLIFNWTGFRSPKTMKLLKDCLQAVTSRPDKNRIQSNNQLCNDFATELSNYTEQCLELTSAVNLIEILNALHQIAFNNVEIRKKIARATSKLLSRPWYDTKGNLASNKESLTHLEVLIQSYLNGANVKTLGGLIATLQNQASALKSKEDNFEMLKSINKQSFHVLYRNFCIYLFERVKTEITSLTNTEHLNLWKTTAVGLQGLMAILQMQETRSNLVHFFKKSIGILKIFLSHGIPVMEIVLRTKTDQVIEILKMLQTTTKFLHRLCCHSKITKDSVLTAHIPQFRLTLETFVFRVRAMLVANDCSAAFWMGNLRNRDLYGEDIPSQSSSVTTTEENARDEDMEEELPPDESENEDDTSMDIENSNQGSASEVYD